MQEKSIKQSFIIGFDFLVGYLLINLFIVIDLVAQHFIF